MTELSLEKKFMLRKFETQVLPSLNRAKTIESILTFVEEHINIQHKLSGAKGRLKPEALAEFMSTKTVVYNPLLSEAMIRSYAYEAYETYLRSSQQLSNLITSRERN